jgi:hypothetical protein
MSAPNASRPPTPYVLASNVRREARRTALTGSNAGNQNFFGSVTVNNFTMSGHAYMHFDEALKNNSGGGAVLSSYKEIPSYPEY